MMTRKHFVKVADYLKQEKASDVVVEKIADMFEEQNPRFDRDRFRKHIRQN